MNRSLEAYADIVGTPVIQQIRALGEILRGIKVVHVNSTSEGGGVAEILTWMVPLMRDLGLDANVLFWHGEARAIDFDDSGFGYYPYDLALALEHCQDDPALPHYRAALLDGYTEVRVLPPEQVRSLDLFLAAFWVYLSLWAAAYAHGHPQHRDVLRARMARAFSLVQRYEYT